MADYVEADFLTKFNVGDFVYYLSDKIESGQVLQKKITFRLEGGTSNRHVRSLIEYRVSGSSVWEEAKLYRTKKEAALAWLEKSDLEPGLING